MAPHVHTLKRFYWRCRKIVNLYSPWFHYTWQVFLKNQELPFLQRTTNPTALKLYKEKVLTHKEYSFLRAERGLSLVKRGGFAFHVDSATGYKILRKTFSEKEICELQEIELFPPQNMVAVLQQGSPYKELMAYG